MDMKTPKILLVILITASMFMTNGSLAQAATPSPSRFHGTVKVNGSNVPLGTPITAWIDGVWYASAKTTLASGNTVYDLDVPKNPQAASIQNASKEGDTVLFHIGDLTASQTGIWHSNTDVLLDLTAIHVPTSLNCTTLEPKPTTVTTGEKPQSKVWTYAGSWFAVFPTTTAGASSAGTWVWKLVGTTWIEVLKLSTRTDTHADVLVDGSLAHILLWRGIDDTDNVQFASIEYVSGSYQLWTERTTLVDIPLPYKETGTIALDSTGEMWLATRASPINIVVYHSASPYSTWDGPIVLETGVLDDDIEVITALPNGTVGVFWSNQVTKRFGFRYHVDGADATAWSVNEIPASQYANRDIGNGMADDHMNVAVASDSTLYVAVKTSIDTSGYPKMALLVRRPDGTWDDLYPVDNAGTRPLVLLDEGDQSLTFIYTSSEGNNSIVYQQSSTMSIAFEGRRTLRSGSFNDVSSMKSNIGDGFVVIYSNGLAVDGQYCSKLSGAPVVTNIPNQTIAEGDSFATIKLDDFVSDVDNTDEQMTWTASGATALSVTIVNRVATITTPDADWNGSETLTFRATDPGAYWDEDAVTFTVSAVNDPPVLNLIGPRSTDELAPLTFKATATDIDLPADTLIYSLADGDDGSIPAGAVIGSTDGDLSWTPTESQGPGTFTFDVCVSDGSVSDCETIIVTVSEVGSAPVAVPDDYEMMANSSLDVPAPGVLANDSDTDIPANTLRIAETGLFKTEHGNLLLSIDGNFVYVPDKGWYGVDTFTYRVSDGSIYSEPVSVTITVKPWKFFLPLIIR
jgi:hypothetical protein